MTHRSPKHDELHLWYLGVPSEPHYVGALRYTHVKRGASLTYSPRWIETGFPLSSDLPLRDIEYIPTVKGLAAGAVDDARPDRWGERVIQYLDNPERLSVMEYLYYAGDDRTGALGISTRADAYCPRPGGPLPKIEHAQTMSDIVAKINEREPITEIEQRIIRTGGSFGGAKPKALVEIDAEQWLIKFFNNEPIDIPLIEHASMTLAARAGITVAQTRVIPLQGSHALLVKRFDRNGPLRIHTISAGTALRAASEEGDATELSYPALAEELRRSGDIKHSKSDMTELFRRMVFNILIDNTDDHEKNHALQVLSPHQYGRARLSPAYDVLPTNSGQGHQELFVGDFGADSTLDNAMSQHHRFDLGRDQAAREVMRVISVVDDWTLHFKSAGVSDGDMEELAERIDGDELKTQRRDFSPTQYAAGAKKAKRRKFELE